MSSTAQMSAAPVPTGNRQCRGTPAAEFKIPFCRASPRLSQRRLRQRQKLAIITAALIRNAAGKEKTFLRYSKNSQNLILRNIGKLYFRKLFYCKLFLDLNFKF
jgi:hypothetical protein